MSTYLHKIPTEIVLLITDFLEEKDIDMLPGDLVHSREEYSIILVNHGLYEKVIFPIKKLINPTKNQWIIIKQYIKKLYKYFLEEHEYKICYDPFDDYKDLSQMDLIVKFIISFHLPFSGELLYLQKQLFEVKVTLIDLFTKDIFGK